jgi:methionine-rich copper-binding protein CopC
VIVAKSNKGLREKIAFVLIGGVCTFFALFTASVASAHTVLISSNPVAGSSLPALPDSISLTFANPLLTLNRKSSNIVTVVDPMNLQIASATSLNGDTVSATLNETMHMSGIYNVYFRVVAQDGHVVTGSFKFTVKTGDLTSQSKVRAINSGVRTYSVSAVGKSQLINGDPQASADGKFTIDFSHNTLCYNIKTIGLSKIMGAHIHAVLTNNVITSVQDEVFIALNQNLVAEGKPGCEKVSNQNLSEIAATPNHYFLMIHTQKYPDGAVGGTLQRAK